MEADKEAVVVESRKKGEKSSQPAGKLIVSLDTPFETIVQSDAKGMVLLFDTKRDFVQLPDAMVSRLSRDNALRYSHARDFHDVWAGDDELAVAAAISVDLQLVAKPTEKLQVDTPDSLQHRWVRPENVRTRLAKNWSIAGERIKSFIGLTNGVHKIGYNGQTELVLMVKDKEQHLKGYSEQVAKNNKLAGTKSRITTPETRQAGLSDYDEGADRKDRAWNEVLSVEKAGEE